MCLRVRSSTSTKRSCPSDELSCKWIRVSDQELEAKGMLKWIYFPADGSNPIIKEIKLWTLGPIWLTKQEAKRIFS